MKNKIRPQKQFPKAARAFVWCLALLCCFSGPAQAMPVETQNLLRQKITLRMENQPVANVLKSLGDLADIHFMYSPELIRAGQTVNLNVSNQSLEQVLNELLTPLHIGYEVHRRQVLLKRKQAVPAPALPMEAAAGSFLFTVSGNVTDEKDEPLPGVNILLKGTSKGAVTDIRGNFTIDVPENSTAPVLVFSFVGYASQEIPVDNRRQLTVKMQPLSTNLDELVVVGYGTVRKSSVTAAISKVENKKLDQIPAGRAETALVGRMAGVNISTSRNTPGTAPIIRIRGAGSITASNDPLIVIDGFPGGSLNNVNMNDVESIEVLKDASSAAIYGSRGSGGVIIVTTKKGKTGKPQLSFNSYVGVGKGIKHGDWISGQEFHDYIARYINRDYAWQGGDVTLPLWGDDRRPANMRVNPVIKEGNTIWEDVLFRPAPIQNYNLSARGGNENVTYYISGTYKDERGILLNTWYKSYSLRANVDARINSFMKAGVMVNPNFSNRRASPVSMEAIVKTAPFVSDQKNANGRYPRPLDYWGTSVSAQVSPLATLEGTNLTTGEFNNIGEMYLSLDLAKGLNLRSSIGTNLTYRTAENFAAAYSSSNNMSTGSSIDQRNINLLNENVLNYNGSFGDHSLNALVGASYQKATSREARIGVLPGSFGNDIIQTLNNAVVNPTATNTTKSQWGLSSYFARVNYAYKDKYLLAASYRTDGSSRFGPKNRWGDFPSASIAWRISKEPFMQHIKAISELKLRASYGVVGNFNIGDFRYLGIISDAQYAPNGVLTKGKAQTSFGNDRLRWERTASRNLGLELGLFNDRLNIVADYYIKRTNDLLYDVSIPSISGFSNTIVNIGDIENKGIELEINSRNFTGDFRWETSFNLSRNWNKVVSLGGVNEVINTHTRGMSWLLRVGEPMFSYYGYKLKGVLMNQADVDNSPVMVGSKPGNTKYEDLNNDGKIDPADRTILGSYLPKVMFGMVNDFSWKNFDLSIVMQSSLGAKMYNLENLYYQGATVSAMRRSLIENQWWSESEPGDGKTPATALSQLAYVSNSDFYLEDASFLAVRNINLGYTFPAALTQKARINSLRVYLSLSNMFMFTRKSFHGYNPEGFTADESDGIKSMPGFNNGAEPVNRIYAFGINLNF